MMKYYELDKKEQKLLEEVESGRWKSVKNLAEEKRKAISAARNTLNKTRNINLRLSARTVARLKARAMREGIPYQTLASSVLHRYVNT